MADRLKAAHLNDLKQLNAQNLKHRFVDQDSLTDERYYEQIIFQDKIIPTRNGSLHDYFNGLIWLRYPNTKAYLNSLHWHDIEQLGHQQRSPARDRITHFDECGLVLVTDIPELKERIAAHDWQWLFVENRQGWFSPENGIMPLHFGHANLEMLCKPFIGLTAKVLIIEDPEVLHLACASQAPNMPSINHFKTFQKIDFTLKQCIQEHRIFAQKGRLYPLPLLGIPGWHNAAQDAAFYANKDYFMPHRSMR